MPKAEAASQRKGDTGMRADDKAGDTLLFDYLPLWVYDPQFKGMCYMQEPQLQR